MKFFKSKTKQIPLLALMLLFVTAGGCDGILDVDDPGSIDEDQLRSPENEELIVAGVRGQFQYTFSYSSLWAQMLTDELKMEHTFADYRPIASREVDETNVITENLFNFWTKSVRHAQDAVEYLEEFHGDEAREHHNMQKVLTYGGYSLIHYAEVFCEGTLDVSEAYTNDELFGMAVDMFDDALDVADRLDASDEVMEFRHLANLGMARAKLNLGEMDQAAQYAAEVPEDFESWLRYSDENAREYNQLYGGATESRFISPGSDFLGEDDIRVPHSDERVGNLVTGTDIYQLFSPMNYEDWSEPIQQYTDVRFANGLEARYIRAEAEGPSEYTLDLVNDRRDFAGQEEVDYTGDELMAELRYQKARDFFLTGTRLGDIRRYKNLYDVDYFPTGEVPLYGGSYGNVTCFPIPQSEVNANPNL